MCDVVATYVSLKSERRHDERTRWYLPGKEIAETENALMKAGFQALGNPDDAIKAPFVSLTLLTKKSERPPDEMTQPPYDRTGTEDRRWYLPGKEIAETENALEKAGFQALGNPDDAIKAREARLRSS